METAELVKKASRTARQEYDDKMARILANDQRSAEYARTLKQKEIMGIKVDELEKFSCTSNKVQRETLAAGAALFQEAWDNKKSVSEVLKHAQSRAAKLDIEEGA